MHRFLLQLFFGAHHVQLVLRGGGKYCTYFILLHISEETIELFALLYYQLKLGLAYYLKVLYLRF